MKNDDVRSMRGKWRLFSSIIALMICVFAVFSFIVLYSHGEDVRKWIPALLCSIFLIVHNGISLANRVHQWLRHRQHS